MFHRNPHNNHFRKNFKMWEKFSPEERAYLRRREDFARQRTNQEIDDAIQKTGLTLTAEQRQQFAFRYMTERHNIEEQLRKKITDMRKPMVDQMIQTL